MKLWLTVSYDGRGYSGWQAQDNAKSVQGTLTRAVSAVYERPCLVTGCSRTDSGVHARAYSCTVSFRDADGGADISDVIPLVSVPRALNSSLPDDIAVLSARVVEDGFHPRYDVKSKTYEYVVRDAGTRSPFLRGLVYETQPIDADALSQMDAAARAMTGRRDFAAFMSSGSKITDTVRNVQECCVRREGEFVIFSVTADGFLYKMVRTMTGTALAAARGRIAPEDIADVIGSRQRSRAFETLPACGLYLCRVEY